MTLDETVRSMKSRGEKGLVPFFTAGYPDEDTFLRLVRAAAEVGCRVVEVGVPFSDPIADGPAIQESSRRALENGMTLGRVLALSREIAGAQGADADGDLSADLHANPVAGRGAHPSADRGENGPAVVLMGYVNPILRMGAERFSAAARRSGVSGAIVPDLPLEESLEIRSALRGEGLAFIDLVAPTTVERRMERIAGEAEGFVYLVSVTGVTGGSFCAKGSLQAFADRVRRVTDAPLYVGFGISSPERAARAADCCDGVIIGSTLVRLVQASSDNDEAVERVRGFLEEVKEAMDGRPPATGIRPPATDTRQRAHARRQRNNAGGKR